MKASILCGTDLCLGYRGTEVVHCANLTLRPGRVTALVGPNGSGKSTLLRAIARLHDTNSGDVTLAASDAEPRRASALSAKEFAREVAMLSQSRPHPSGLSVRDIVTYGRHPHRGRFAGLRDQDRAAVDTALEFTGLTPMADRSADELSGGELQRVWLGTALAQDTGVLLLDEPTNHLDLKHQMDTLDLICDLAARGTAVGVVLHDLDQAAGVADEVVLLAGGNVLAAGAPEDVLTGEHLSAVYGLPIDTTVDEETKRVRVFPRARHRQRPRRLEPEVCTA
ncbi:ABC transporter ATP-binding protein [Leucobacter aridicollis]|uniref:ABC transporter ATP-binding protein n=1 Tax=Leucobacter aridicollis TaxID=283878 RepID=UPI002167838F|nr:ABC transporter ATP-binding protein [Leucobacter aridicollis]MCS3428643.1 iron complex transport system ATP-binding protein [Leucobacter aridicollis]